MHRIAHGVVVVLVGRVAADDAALVRVAAHGRLVGVLVLHASRRRSVRVLGALAAAAAAVPPVRGVVAGGVGAAVVRDDEAGLDCIAVQRELLWVRHSATRPR